MTQAKFFIRDCNGNIVGNPKGYRTIKGAIQQQNQKGSPAYNAIWKAYWDHGAILHVVSNIKQG